MDIAYSELNSTSPAASSSRASVSHAGSVQPVPSTTLDSVVKWWSWYVVLALTWIDVTTRQIPGSHEPGRRTSVRETASLPPRALGSAPMTLQTHTRAIPVTSPPLNRSSSFTLPLSPPPSPPPRYSRARESEAFHGSTTSPAHANVHTSSSTLPLQNVDALRTSLHQVNRFDVPGTPDMSPANGDVHHYPAATAEAFVRRLFVDLPAIGAWKAEDAGIELMCPGWSGAVIEKFSTASSSTSSASLACASEKLNRALYVHMPSGCDRSQLRDHMLAILDTASDAIHASKVVFCLERSLPDLSSLLHGMCYVGGQVISIGGQLDEWVAAHPIPSMVLVAVSL